MILIENQSKPIGLEHAIRGMRNPMNSWDKSDSYKTYIEDPETMETAEYEFFVGEKDLERMRNLAAAGTDHRKFMRMITVYLDITAPLYWWKEFDTYKIGTVANSCSTMHKIQAKEFVWEDFSCEHLDRIGYDAFANTISSLNLARDIYLSGGCYGREMYEPKDKRAWYQMIQLLPSSYNQKRTVMLNYEVLANMYKSRKNHKLDEWRAFCGWIECLPYSELITGKVKESED